MADGRLAVSVDVTHGSFVAGDGLFIDSIAVGGPEEIDLTGSISYKEFLSPKPCIAQWYCCHWWGESLDSFVSSCQTHAQLRRRGSPGSAGGYWVAAFAMRQHELREELGPDLKESPFYDALRLADGILLTVDSEEVFRRTWCHYELYAGSDLKHLDVVCNGAMLSRTGLPGESMVAKQDQEGTLKVDETVCSTFALLAWPQAVKRGLVSTQLIETVASDVNREALELSLAHLQEFQDPGMLQLAQSLPPNLTKLKLGLEGCHELTDQGVKALANRWGTKLKHLYLDFVGCGKLTDASLSVLAQNLPPTLTDLELHMAGCVLVGPPGMELGFAMHRLVHRSNLRVRTRTARTGRLPIGPVTSLESGVATRRRMD
ncbi:unnamed protein product [Durusdinium trenchii]|uniref:Distal membrane arm assembly complex 2-like protein n=1 Tax=Durusdinium trenchii TaxID=1381693 RepID=A0ABP0JCD7_9DINO